MALPILSNKSLVNWLSKQPADGKYNYTEGSKCLIANYLADKGIDAAVNPQKYRVRGKERFLPVGWDSVAQGIGNATDWTYGAALGRAKKELELA